MARTLETFGPDAVAQRLDKYNHTQWALNDAGELESARTFKNFSQAMQFANAVAYLAQTADHHPDMLIHGWKNVTIRLMTHDQGGITDLDFEMVQQIDELPQFDQK